MSSVLSHDDIKKMLVAFVDTLIKEGGQFSDSMKQSCEQIFEHIAEQVNSIQTMLAKKQLDLADAQDMLAMQKQEASIALCEITGSAKVLVQNGINAAFNTVSDLLDKLLNKI